MKVAICDDEKIVTASLKKLVEAGFQKRGENVVIKEFNSGKELLEEIQLYSAVFLDMDMPEADGITIGKEIVQKNPSCITIMATGREDRYRDAFHIHAKDFITKPFKETEVCEAIDIILKNQIGSETIDMYCDRIKYGIRQRDIIYVEAYNGYIQCYTKNMILRKESSLLEVQKDLDERIFFKVRREMLVNMIWVDKYCQGKVYLHNKIVNVSRAIQKEFEKAYREFDLNYG